MTKKNNRKPKMKVKQGGGKHPKKQGIVHGVCAVTNPFCGAARGAKWFSTSAVSTITHQEVVFLPIATGTQGSNLFAFFPNTSGLHYKSQAMGTLTLNITTLGGATPDTTSFLNACATVRIVSAGIQVWDAAPMTDVGGVTIMTEFANFTAIDGISLAWSSATQGSANLLVDRREKSSFVSKPSNDDAYDFIVPDPLDTKGSENARTGVVIATTGAPNTTVAYVKFTVNYEGTLLAANAFAQSTSVIPVKVVDPIIKKTTIMADKTASSFYTGAVNTVEKLIETQAGKAFDFVLEELSSLAIFV
jgi:hypothetical protein